MRTALKIALGALSILYYVSILLGFLVIGTEGTSDNPLVTAVFALTIASIPALAAFYVVIARRSKTLSKTEKNLWTVFLIWGNILAFPAFWYLYIWRQPRRAAGNSSDLVLPQS